MGLFGKKETVSPALVGVDIGAGGIKVVELMPEKGRVKLERYAYADIDTQPGVKSVIDDPKRAAEILTQLLKQADVKSKRANASLPASEIFHAIITIPQPKSSKENIKPMIELQVRKLLPVPLENMILDSTVIDKDLLPKAEEVMKKAEKDKPKESVKEEESALTSVDHAEDIATQTKHVRILVSGAPKDLVAKYVETFRLAGLELAALETEAFALIRSLIGKDKSRIMIVDIGQERANIMIVDNGIPFLHRSVKAGGGQMTDLIAKKMGVDRAAAEQMKRDLAHAASQGELPPVLKEAMMPIVHEVKYSLELYAQQQSDGSSGVEKIILTGGSANLPQIDRVLSTALDMNVYIGDPWARIAAYPDLSPLLEEIGSRFAVAAGLAMKVSS